MRTRFVGHACLEIEAGGLRVVTDPRWAGPAYTGQWHAWPTPRPEGLEERPIDFVYLSHGHEDHLHAPTLARLRRGATLLVPAFLTDELAGYARSLGFAGVRALRHGERVRLGRGVSATCLVNGPDSMLALEEGDEVLVDANDALHAAPAALADHFCDVLRRRWPRIDAFFLGFGGASWFPNCIRLPGKDDRRAAADREALLADNFARVVARIQPRLACAFAASFVLLEPHLRWVNEVKLTGPGPAAALARRTGGAIPCRQLLPGDVVEGASVVPGPGADLTAGGFRRACREELAAACARAEALAPLAPIAVDALALAVEARLAEAGAGEGRPRRLGIRLRDGGGATIAVEAGGGRVSARRGEVPEGAPVLELRSEVLLAAMADPYGSESITIGCGAVADLARPADLDVLRGVLRLLAPRASPWQAIAAELRRRPIAAARDALAQRWPLALHAAVRAGLVSHLHEAAALA
jgi:hypothetical protein